MNNAQRTMIHISHLHPLKLVVSPKPKPICHACNIQCGNQSFGCIECRYFLHVTCATSKRCVNHPAHPAHNLTFELTPNYISGKFQCDACGVEGNTFGFRCRDCCYDLHLHCSALPHFVNHPSHSHPLSIVYKNPYPSGTCAICDLCKNYLDPCKWFYLCRSCDFGGHIGCFSPEKPEVLSPGLQAQPTLPSNPQEETQANVLLNTVNSIKQEQLLFAQAKAAQTMMVGSSRLVNSFQWRNNLL
ncbi:hypothetical protein LUZ62_045294 [Rhynchospora pubera]|uniref:DC1 domain-containing protein n=1 Tax=Rhynchospora pubera TaxID=906938 RepID=A0AAV8FTB4_9POAL|nr:hypothetical protein LUZ62_045294 [Rhynchospora pubera]